MAKKRILVTGVGGFIASNLADRLVREGYPVVGIDNLSQGFLEQIPKEVEFHNLDIRSKEIAPLFKSIDVVFHLAAKTNVSECQEQPYLTADINVMGTLNVFDACRAAGVKRVIYVESSAVYEGSTKLPTPESDFAPQTFYGISKGVDHLFGKAYQEFFGMQMIGLRYFNVYGPRQDYRRGMPPLMSRFIIKLLMGEKKLPVFGDGTDRRDYVHVDDVNDLHLILLESPNAVGKELKVYNVGSGTNNSILEIKGFIEEVMGVKAEVEFVPNIPGAAKETLADISSAQKLGWQPKASLKEGLRGMVDYIKDQVAQGNITKST
jgi:UDP-glucose 4-epimerase